MRIPAWLDPLWHVDFEISTALPADGAIAVLQSNAGRLRGQRENDGAIIVVRRGGFVNQFVRARATVVPTSGGSTVQVRVARPPLGTIFFAVTFVLLVAVQLVQVLLSAVFDAQRLVQSAVFFLIGAFIWVTVIGINYTSARNEAKDLQRLIGQALSAR